MNGYCQIIGSGRTGTHFLCRNLLETGHFDDLRA